MRTGRNADVLVVSGFFAFCSVMGVLSLVQSPDHGSFIREGRAPSPFPELQKAQDARRFPARFESYFQDRLAFRQTLLNAHAAIRVWGLGVSSSPKVIVGTDGWLFLDPSSEAQGVNSAPADVRARRWLECLQQWRDWCASRGIRFLFVLVPEKQTVYPDKLPASHRPPQPALAADHLRRLAPPMLSESFLDLTPVLREASRDRGVYFRTDTHWNDEGGWLGYDTIARRLGFTPISANALLSKLVPNFEGDLARMLHLPRPETEITRTLHYPAAKARLRDEAVPLDPRWHSPRSIQPEVWGVDDRQLPRGVMFHDSFAQRVVIPRLAEHFHTLVYAPSVAPDPKVIERFAPQVVVQQLVERRINHHDPIAPP